MLARGFCGERTARQLKRSLEIALRDQDGVTIAEMNAFPESVELRDQGRALLPGSRVLV